MLCWRSLAMTLLICCAASAAAASPREKAGAVSVRIHDYSQMDRGALRQAEREVARIYRRINVRLDFRTAVRPRELAAGRGRWPADGITMITIVVLDAAMAEKLDAPVDIAGYAPITRERGGRIAFVFGDRVRAIAAQGDARPADVLTGVIAHEMAHLLMPLRSHSEAGVMRACWAPGEFKEARRQGFSDVEAASIRQMVNALTGSASRVAD